MSIAKLDPVPTTWMSGQDDEGLPYFTEDAFWNFLEDYLASSPFGWHHDGGLHAEDYQAAREQLWAIREDEAD